MNETLEDIGFAIKKHRIAEKNSYADVYAVGRASCEQRGREETIWLLPLSEEDLKVQKIRDITGVCIGTKRAQNGPLRTEGRVVFIDSQIGDVLLRNHKGTHPYKVPAAHTPGSKPSGRYTTSSITINNRANYSVYSANSEASEINIYINDEDMPHQFQELSDLIGQTERIKKAKEEQERKEAEVRRQEAEAARKRREAELEAQEAAKKAEEAFKAEQKRKAEEEEAKRKEAERKAEELRKEEERKKIELELINEGIAKLVNDLDQTKAQIKETQSWIRKELGLRQEHFIDASQNTAKRGHLYDGVPLVIEGGPGTGKTTTLIQRLKFLISKQSLTEYAYLDGTLTEAQVQEISNIEKRDDHWLFFSPTPMLLKYLRENMRKNGLEAKSTNTTVLEDFRKRMMREYKLTNPDNYKPFKSCRPDDNEKILIKEPIAVIKGFEAFCVENISFILLLAGDMKTSDFKWHDLAVKIKSYCKKADTITSLDDLMRLFNSLQDNEYPAVQKLKLQMEDLLKNISFQLTQEISADETMKIAVSALFDKWRKETVIADTEEVSEDEQEEDIDEEEEQAFNSAQFETKLFSELKKLIKPISIKTFSGKTSLSKRLKEFYDIVGVKVAQVDLTDFGQLYWFNKKFADLCKGIESNILNQIPRLYKAYRIKLIKERSDLYDRELLEKLVTKDKNGRLHSDEENLLIGFINNLLLSIYRKSRTRFNSLVKNKFLNAYQKNMKYVIGVDEATDYSLLDFYCISSFRHCEKSSITLCGDSMQALNGNGIKSWSELDNDHILKGLTVHELTVSYRQLPTLVDMSRQMYFDDRGEEAPYQSKKKRYDSEPKPLICVSDDEDIKARWIAKRIVEVYKFYDYQMPSVAIFVGENVDIKKFIKLIYNQDVLNNIKIVEGEEAIEEACVRIFRISEVKGMEFEVAFFHNIDEALNDINESLMRRYLYVGISRATTHLAATMTESEGYEHIIQYFDTNADSWII